MSLLKRISVFSLVVTTVLWSVGVSFANVSKAATYGAGSLLAQQGVSGAAVYFVGNDGKKYVFPDAKTYFTWYSNFDSVKKVPVSELDMYPDGGAVTYRPGTKLVTHPDTAKIYAIEPGGIARWIPDAATAQTLWGANWTKRVQDVIPGFFSSSYNTGSDVGSTYPTGSIVQMGSTVYYIDGSTKRPFANADAFEANDFNWDDIVTVTSLNSYSDGSSITGEESNLSAFMGVSSGSGNTGGTLSVSLASDTPASGVAVTGAARLPFTKVKLMTGDKGVTIDSMVVERGGLGQDGAFSSVDILDGTTMLPIDSNSKTFNSSHQATFTKDWEIPANSTRYVYLAGNMGTIGATYAGEFPTLGLASVTLVGGGSVTGALPVFGNYQTTNGSITIGSATVSRGAYTNATSSTLEVGKTDYTFFSFSIQAGSAEDTTFSQVSVYQEGTAVLGEDLVNLELFKDGTKVADGTVDGKYVHFTFAPMTIAKGQTGQYLVRADVDGGSARTVDLGIYRPTDLLVKGMTYGYNITPTYSGTGSSASNPRLSDNTFTISRGTLTVERGTSVGSENIGIGNNQTLGAFKFTVKGEPIDITAMTLTIVSSSTGTIEDALTGVKLVNGNGVVVAGPTDVTNNALTVAFTDTFTLPVGESQYKVMANLATNGGWATNDTIYVRLASGASALTAEGTVTGENLLAGTHMTPTSNIDTNTQTIKGAYLQVTRDTLPSNGNVVAGAQDVLLGSWSFNGSSSGEDIRITSIVFAASSSAATNLTVYDGVYGNGGTAKSPINDAPATTVDGASSTFAFDDPIIITKGTSKTIQLVGDITSNASANNSSEFGLTDATAANNPSVVAYGVSTGNRATLALTADNGAVLTYSGAGSVTVTTHNNPSNGIVRAGGTGVTMGYVKFDALNEDLDLDQLIVHVADGGLTGTATGNYQDILKVYLYDGATLISPAGGTSIPSTGYYTFDFNNNTLVVPKGGSKILTMKADFGTIDQTNDNAPATPAADIAIGLGGTDGFKFTGVASNTVVTSETYSGSTSSVMVLHKAVPTVTFSESGSTLGAATSLVNGASNVFAFRVAADSAGSEVLLYRSSFEISTGGGSDTTVTSCYLKDGDGNTVGASANPTVSTAGGGKSLISYVFNNPSISAGDTKEALSVSAGSSKTYTLNCTVANAGSGDYLSVSLLGDTASSTPAASHGTPSSTGQNVADAWTAFDKGNFIWSDNYKNRGLATDGANATAYGQWYNGYLVNGLGVNTTASAYTIGWSS